LPKVALIVNFIRHFALFCVSYEVLPD